MHFNPFLLDYAFSTSKCCSGFFMTTGGWVIWWWHDGLMTQWTDYLMTQWHKASQTIDIMIYFNCPSFAPSVYFYTHRHNHQSYYIGWTHSRQLRHRYQPAASAALHNWRLAASPRVPVVPSCEQRHAYCLIWLFWYWYWQQDVHHLHRGLDSVFRTRLRIASWHYLHSYPVIRNIQR